MNQLMPTSDQVEARLTEKFTPLFEAQPELKSFVIEWAKAEPWEQPDLSITHVNGFGDALHGAYLHDESDLIDNLEAPDDMPEAQVEAWHERTKALLLSLYKAIKEAVEVLDADTTDAMTYVLDEGRDKYRPSLDCRTLAVERCGVPPNPNALSVELE